MAWIDPDWPTEIGNFIANTYQMDQMLNNQFYYNGGTAIPMGPGPVNPFDNGQYAGSRRNTGFNNPMMDPNAGNLNPSNYQTGMPTPPTFAPTPQQPAFNSLVDTRRNQTMMPNNDPWATKPLGAPTLLDSYRSSNPAPTPTISQPPTYSQQPCFCYNGGGYGYGYAPNGLNSLYGDTLSYDRRCQAWDAQQTRYYTPNPGNIWNNNLNPSGYRNDIQMTVNPNFTQVQPTWSEIVDRNFSIK